jgi:hypothetical protein
MMNVIKNFFSDKWEINGKKVGKFAFVAFKINIINTLKKLTFSQKNFFKLTA